MNVGGRSTVMKNELMKLLRLMQPTKGRAAKLRVNMRILRRHAGTQTKQADKAESQ